MRPPTEKETWPRLSIDLPHPRHPLVCQSCGHSAEELYTTEADQARYLSRWQEHDTLDRPEMIAVMLCPECSAKLIEPHERLYSISQLHAPFPGAMPTCIKCVYRDGLHCSHLDLKENGGKGLILTVAKPMTGFWDGADKTGRRTGGPMKLYTKPIICKQRLEAKPKEQTIPPPAAGQCRSCQALIAWMRTPAGKTIPVDYGSIQDGDLEYDSKKHVSHFSTCPQASTWSKKNKKVAS